MTRILATVFVHLCALQSFLFAHASVCEVKQTHRRAVCGPQDSVFTLTSTMFASTGRCPGTALKSEKERNTRASCANSCLKDSSCVAFDWASDSNMCQLYSDLIGLRDNVDDDSGSHICYQINRAEGVERHDMGAEECATFVKETETCGAEFLSMQGECTCIVSGTCTVVQLDDSAHFSDADGVYEKVCVSNTVTSAPTTKTATSAPTTNMSIPQESGASHYKPEDDNVKTTIITAVIVVITCIALLLAINAAVRHYFASTHDPDISDEGSDILQLKQKNSSVVEELKTRNVASRFNRLVRKTSLPFTAAPYNSYYKQQRHDVPLEIIPNGGKKDESYNSGMPIVQFPNNSFYVASYDIIDQPGSALASKRRPSANDARDTLLVDLDSLSYLELRRLAKSKGMDWSGTKEDIYVRLKENAINSRDVQFNVDPDFLIFMQEQPQGEACLDIHTSVSPQL